MYNSLLDISNEFIQPNLTCNINLLKNIFENSNSLGGKKHLLEIA